MGDVEVRQRRRPPQALRWIAWITLGFGAWGLADEARLLVAGDEVRPLFVLIDIGVVVVGIGLVKRRRWGYFGTLVYYVVSVVWAAWFFATHGDDSVGARLWGLPVVAVGSLPIFFLLTPKARAWLASTRAHTTEPSRDAG